MGDYRKETKFIAFDNQNSRKILKTDTIVDSVIDSFVNRASIGKQKYGTDLDRNDLSLYEWIEHMQTELQDAILYLEKIKKIIGGKS
jgi:hypothetical protein